MVFTFITLRFFAHFI
jgi:meiotic recombination protein SPO11